MPSISVIISTYNKPNFLEKVLTGYAHQTFKDFEIIIADDGSTKKTKNIINKFSQSISQDIIHVWQKDNGFRKCKILNKAIIISSNEYLVFSDGDCIPNRHFLDTHNKLAKSGYFLSGGHFPVNEKVSNAIKLKDIEAGDCFNKSFIFKNGQPLGKNFFKLIKNSFLAKCLDQITPTKNTFNGNNSSSWRKDIIFSNGFDERMEYGGLDCELGYRLNNNGIKSIQVRNRATVIHLYHTRPYKNAEAVNKNRKIRKNTLQKHIKKTNYGIENQ
jgi:glycosyltransferase involved in cell wall biosynthesis|tara:strand:- start:4711 stop:5526 length:816 start_codon:yes stop_codon:yes gene_type:complete